MNRDYFAIDNMPRKTLVTHELKAKRSKLITAFANQIGAVSNDTNAPWQGLAIFARALKKDATHRWRHLITFRRAST